MLPLTSPDSINQILIQIFHWFFIIGSILYMIFAFLVVRQIDLMKKTLITNISPVITLLGLGHLVLAIWLVSYYLFFF